MNQIRFGILALILALQTVSGQSRQPSMEEKVVIGGKAVDGVSGVPLDKLRLVIASADRPDQELASQTTGADGRFSFLMEKGRYTLIAERNGIGRQLYGNRGIEYNARIAIIADGSRNYDQLVFPVYPPAAISGKLSDNFGEPVEGARVQLLRYNYLAGKKRLRSRGYAFSNDKGEYRFGNLFAGSYFLVAGGEPWHEKTLYSAAPVNNLTKTAYLPTYFPNSSNPSGAAPLNVQAGAEIRANLTLSEVEGYRIRVRVEGERNTPIRLQLTSAGLEGLSRLQSLTTFYPSEYDIPSVSPGSYTVEVSAQNNKQTVSATANVQVNSADAIVTLTLKPAASVSGQVTCGGKPLPRDNAALVSLWREDINQGLLRRVQADSSFFIPDVPPDHYMVLLSNAGDCYLKSLYANGKEIPSGSIRIDTANSENLMIEANHGLSQLSGLLTQRGEALSGALVLLAPVAESIDPADYPSHKTDSDGTFNFRYVRPGAYYLYAVDDPEFEFANRNVIKPYLERAIKISIEPFSKSTKDFELTTIK